MKILPFLILFIISCDCNHDTDDLKNLPLPDCIDNMLSNSPRAADLQTIRAHKLGGEIHYWLNTDFMQMDGVEYIVNMNCDTICGFCGYCLPSPCAKAYCGDWQVIWKR